MESYIEAMAVKFKVDTALVEKNFNENRGNVTRLLPCEQRLQSRTYTGDLAVSEQERELYHQGVGTLNFLGIFARPDICYGVSVLASFVQNPSTVHLRALYHLLGYCWITKSEVITYRRGQAEFKWKLAKHDVGPNEEVGFGDSSFADCFETRRSQTGVVVMLNGATVAWKSVRQPVCALSTCESECYALAELARIALFVRKILIFFKVSNNDRPIKYGEDNAACVTFVQSDKLTSRVRWFDVCLYKLRDLDRERRLVCVKVDTKHQLADPLTKSLAPDEQRQHRRALLGLADWAPPLPAKTLRTGEEAPHKKLKTEPS
jgi:hypothetical protein